MRFNETTDPSLRSFVDVLPDSDFPLQNLPYGIFRRDRHDAPRAGIAVGEFVLDLSYLEHEGLLGDSDFAAQRPFSRRSLNHFLSMGPKAWSTVRRRISNLLSANQPLIRDNGDVKNRALIPRSDAELLLPVEIGDYTDFYSSREHATNVGKMFRGEENALMPNWLHLPVAYHGRSSSVFVSGTPVVRPAGQLRPDDGPPQHGATRLLDFELEVGAVIGPGNVPGQPIPISNARDHVFGMVLVNDWSARDIQAWEYVPLGPFLGKNFATTISPWIVPLEALEPFQVEPPAQEPVPLPYLCERRRTTFDLHLEVSIRTSDSASGDVVCRSNFRHLYWTIDQQVAHHTVNGCALRPGDLLASGTISGSSQSSFGSLLELSWRGSRQVQIGSGIERTFLLDGDTVVLRGWAQGDGYRIGFGEASGEILPHSF